MTDNDAKTFLYGMNAVQDEILARRAYETKESKMNIMHKAAALVGVAAVALASFTATASATVQHKHLTQQQQSAVRAAKQYLSFEAFSRLGLIAQLDSPDGSGYSVHNATVAVDSMTVNWNTEAVKAAKAYLAMEAFSCSGLIQQLDSPDGSQFTVAQATYGADHSGNGC